MVSRPPLHAALISLVADGLTVLRVRDGVPLTDEQIEERAVNVVAALVGNYEVAPMFETPLIAGRPAGHSGSCRCDRCDTYNRSVRKDPQ